MSQETVNEVVTDPRWFVEDYDPQQQALSFVRADREALAHEPFLDARWIREGMERRAFPLGAVAAAMPAAAAPRLNVVWHTSFCGSTLIAEALDLPGRNLSLREPFVLVPVADAKRAALQTNKPLPPRLSDVVFRLLGRSTIEGERVTVKPSNIANVLIAEAARETQGQVLFLYSDLENFLISIEKGGVSLRKYARRLFGNIAGDRGTPLRWQARDIFQMTDLEIAAIAWHMQIELFRREAEALGAGRVASLDNAAFLADPAGMLAALDRFFGLGLGADHVARVMDGPLLKRHAKERGQAFDAETRRAQSDAVRQRMGDDLERVVEWSYRAFPQNPRDLRLPGRLDASGSV